MSDKYFAIDLDDFTEDVFHFLERIQDGRAGHRVAFEADNKESAAKIISERLLPFLTEQLYESDDRGRPIEWADED